MRTDGLFTVREYTIETKFGKEIKIIPFGDIHRDSPAFADETWKEFLARAKRLPDAYFLGMGDYFDSYSTSERDIMNSGRLHESSTKRHETEARARVGMLSKELSFMKGRILGMLGGNHFFQFRDGSTSDHLLCQNLGTRYLGVCCALRVKFQLTGNSRASIDIFAHHGRGAGQTAGGKFNSVEKLANICEADIYLMGDNHARGAIPAGDRLRIMSNPKGDPYIRSRTPWLARTGSFLKGYEDGQSNYIVDGALPPANLGWVEFNINIHQLSFGGERTIEVKIGATT